MLFTKESLTRSTCIFFTRDIWSELVSEITEFFFPCITSAYTEKKLGGLWNELRTDISCKKNIAERNTFHNVFKLQGSVGAEHPT